MELIVITVLALKPVESLAKLWATKTLGTTQSGLAHTTAEILNVVTTG